VCTYRVPTSLHAAPLPLPGCAPAVRCPASGIQVPPSAGGAVRGACSASVRLDGTCNTNRQDEGNHARVAVCTILHRVPRVPALRRNREDFTGRSGAAEARESRCSG
jgi:hypothetical protein